MNKSIKKYWKSEIELTNNAKLDALRENEFVDKLPLEGIIDDEKSLKDSSTNRRDFLKYLGFSVCLWVKESNGNII